MLERLIAGARAMGIDMSPAQAEMLREYHALITKANSEINLTRVSDDFDEAVDRNYLDSISPVGLKLFAPASKLADVGSGAGFPGIPLSIMLPEVEITLIDALGKRVKFLNEVIACLGLNARAVHARAEEAGRSAELRENFDVVTARAVAPVNILCEYALPLVKTGGFMLAYKGPAWQSELEAAQNALAKLGGAFRTALDAPIPGRDWRHSLVIIDKIAPTPAQFPRRTGVPEKRPL